jgi:hypothetical protein
MCPAPNAPHSITRYYASWLGFEFTYIHVVDGNHAEIVLAMNEKELNLMRLIIKVNGIGLSLAASSFRIENTIIR